MVRNQSDESLYVEGMQAVTQSLPIVNQVLTPKAAIAFSEGVEDGRQIKAIIDSDLID